MLPCPCTSQGTVVVVRTETVDALTGVMVALNEFTIFALGTGAAGRALLPACAAAHLALARTTWRP